MFPLAQVFRLREEMLRVSIAEAGVGEPKAHEHLRPQAAWRRLQDLGLSALREDPFDLLNIIRSVHAR